MYYVVCGLRLWCLGLGLFVDFSMGHSCDCRENSEYGCFRGALAWF